MRLLSVREISDDESLHGYIKWLAEDNHFTRVADLGELANGRSSDAIPLLFRHHFFSSSCAERLSLITGLPLDRLKASSYQRLNGTKVLWRHHIVDLHALSPHFPKYCSNCLRDRKRQRAIWDLKVFQACPEHNVWLDSGCPKCGEHLGWQKTLNTRCTCGLSLIRDRPRFAPAPVISLMRLLEAKVNGMAPFESNFDPEIARLPLNDLANIIRLIGQLSWTEEWTKRSYRQSGKAVRHIVEAAALALQQWPTSLVRILDRLVATNRKRKAPGSRRFPVSTAYSPAWMLVRSAGEAWQDLIRVHIREHRAAYVAASMPIEICATRLKISFWLMRAIRDAGLIKVTTTRTLRCYARVTPSALDQFITALESRVTNKCGSDETMISMRSCLSLLRTSMVDVLGRILRGALRPVLWDKTKPGFWGLTFSLQNFKPSNMTASEWKSFVEHYRHTRDRNLKHSTQKAAMRTAMTSSF